MLSLYEVIQQKETNRKRRLDVWGQDLYEHERRI